MSVPAVATPTVADLLDDPALGGARVLAGEPGLDTPVHRIGLVEAARVSSAPLAPGTLAVLTETGTGRWEHLVDLLVRRVRAAGAAGLVLPHGPADVSAAPIRLAERLGVPLLVRGPGIGDVELAVRLTCLVRDAAAHGAAVLMGLAGSPAPAPRSPEELVAALEAALGGRAAVVSARRGLVAGSAGEGVVREALGVAGGIPVVLADPLDGTLDGTRWVALPVVAAAGGSRAWLLLGRPDPGNRWITLAGQALALVRGEIVAWLALDQLDAEREAGLRAALLTEIVEHREAVAPDVVRRAEQLGWRLVGWHTACYVHVEGPERVPTWMVDGVVARLGAAGIDAGPAVERSDGWVTWLTTGSPPAPARLQAATRVLREQLHDLAARYPGSRISLGIGSARRDAEGIARSVAEAREAAHIAGGGRVADDQVAVRVVQDLGASRLLLGWYGSGAFADLSRQVLGPLANADDPALVTTLGAYLERACSAAQTARALGVHRNTISQRIARIEKILGVSLSQADTRLALQLALRAQRGPA